MKKVDIVNESGYKALLNLAKEQPDLFKIPNTDNLCAAMTQEAGTENVWGQSISFDCSLNPLNELMKEGPDTDSYYARIMRKALTNLQTTDFANELIWASINCFIIPKYVPIRWATSNIANTNPSSFVERHWLKSGPDGRESNAAARLWWLGELSERAAPFSQHNADKLLDTMANNVNLYHQCLARRYLIANPRLLAVIYDVALDGNDHLFQTKYATELFKSLNLRAGATAFDFMDDDDLRGVVEEAIPPKGR